MANTAKKPTSRVKVGGGTSKKTAKQTSVFGKMNKWVMITAFVIVFGGLGSYFIFASHADSLTGDIPVPADYNGDGKADIGIFRPSDGTWHISTTRTATTTTAATYGQAGDIPVPAAYNGGKTAMIAVWRPSNGTWYVRGNATVQYGQNGDIPVPGDYNGDGKVDLAVFRPSNCTFYVRGISTSAIASPCVGATPVTFVPSIGLKFPPYVAVNTNGTLMWRTPTDKNAGIPFGLGGDIPTPGDWQLASSHNFAVWRPSNGTWYVSNGQSIIATVQWGQKADIPVAADYNGDGKADYAVWRPSTATWYLKGITTVKYGNPR
jgi:hypothetical protein